MLNKILFIMILLIILCNIYFYNVNNIYYTSEKFKNNIINKHKNDYDKIRQYDNSNHHYYYNDIIDQSKINEDYNDLINQTDKIDYSDIKTGFQKCIENCNGNCFQIGYNGVGVCDTTPIKQFDYGTLQ